MNTYELMINTNRYLIKGGEFTEAQKINIVNQFLVARSDEKTKQSFYKGVNAPEYLVSLGKSNDGRKMYPLFYIPPYNNGKKLQTVIPMSPKTHILSANSYELEIIRLLYLFAPDDSTIKDMGNKTLARLKTTCFGYQDCHVGECFHSALIVLRFLAAVTPDDTEWIKKLISLYKNHINDAMRHSGVTWYYWLCLSELPIEIAETEIRDSKDAILRQLNRSCVMNSESDKTIHPVLICTIRNVMARLPEYAYIKDRQPYINEKDGRLYFDMSEDL